MAATSVFLCRLEELPDGGSRGFDPLQKGHDTLLVVRQGQQLYAYRDACPHEGGTPMAWRKDAYLSGDRQHIVCHAHGAKFDIPSGICTLGPCLGDALDPLDVTLDPDGSVYLVLNN